MRPVIPILCGLCSKRALGIGNCHVARGDYVSDNGGKGNGSGSGGGCVNPLLISRIFHCIIVDRKHHHNSGVIKQPQPQQPQCNRNSRYLRIIAAVIHRSKTHNCSSESLDQTDSNMLNDLPFFTCGEIVRGFGRGSKDLGIPTANYSLEVVQSLPSALIKGIYYGWANVDNGEVYKMVMSIGTNPYYDNKEKSMETHIIHKFDGDLYGHILKVCIVGYLRPERNFDSLEELIDTMHGDIEEAKKLLDTDDKSRQLRTSKYFNEEEGNSEESSSPKTPQQNGDTLKNGS